MKNREIIEIVLRLLAITFITLTATYARGQDVVLDCPEGMEDSTDAIQNGLWATRESGTLHLGECTYYVTRVIEARWNHHGAMQGMGKDKTVIEILPGAKINAVPIAAEGGYPLSPLFLFENPESGDITISDLSFVITDPQPAVGNDPFFNDALWTIITVTGPEINARIENAGFLGASGYFFETNVGHAIQVYNYPGVNGGVTISGCEFSNVWDGLNPFNFHDAIIDISRNKFADVGFGAIVENCSGCTAKVSRNAMDQVGVIGVFVIHDAASVPLEPSNYLVEKNSIDLVTADGNGIYLLGRPMSAVVSQNNINVESFSSGVGIFGLDTDGVLVTNNKIDGTGFAGILTLFSDEGTFIGNNVQNFSTLPWGPAPITLWESSDFRVVGGSNRTNVYWEGGGGHVFTGVNVSEYSDLGQDVSEAIARKQVIIKTMP